MKYPFLCCVQCTALLQSENGHRASYCMLMENKEEQTMARNEGGQSSIDIPETMKAHLITKLILQNQITVCLRIKKNKNKPQISEEKKKVHPLTHIY